VIIVGAYAPGFNESWLGRRIDPRTVDSLLDMNKRFGISLVGEGGEYETLVLDAPYFKRRVQLLRVEKVWEDDSGYLLVKEARLVGKSTKT